MDILDLVEIFYTLIGNKKEKTTCSPACANTYFRSGENNPNFKGITYRQVCFRYHNKECIICGEDLVVEVHHYDCNNKNNDPKNLIPLCPTHHKYIHGTRNNMYVIKECVDEYYNMYNL